MKFIWKKKGVDFFKEIKTTTNNEEAAREQRSRDWWAKNKEQIKEEIRKKAKLGISYYYHDHGLSGTEDVICLYYIAEYAACDTDFKRFSISAAGGVRLVFRWEG